MEKVMITWKIRNQRDEEASNSVCDDVLGILHVFALESLKECWNQNNSELIVAMHFLVSETAELGGFRCISIFTEKENERMFTKILV